jgi:hypothetical protein
MSVLALWLSKILWGWEGLVLGLSLLAGIGLVVTGLVGFSCLGARRRQ